MTAIWVGSPIDVRHGQAAKAALKTVNDALYWDNERGVVAVNRDRWEKAQEFEAEGWLNHWKHATSDRNHEHIISFDNYRTVPQDLGDVIEIGCGPFTQLCTIQEERTVKSVTLLDPLIDKYKTLPQCAYHGGKFLDHPTVLLSRPAEELDKEEIYDTAICINVLEHVQNALQVLHVLHKCLKAGGTLIFGERVYDGLDITEIYDVGHPIRIKMAIFDEWEKQFAPLFKVLPQFGHPLQQEHYFIGTKL